MKVHDGQTSAAEDRIVLRIRPGGETTTIYSDALAGLAAEGEVRTTRASHVEPGPDGRWYADLAPAGGPTLGPYPLRQHALDAEVEWLRTNVLRKESV